MKLYNGLAVLICVLSLNAFSQNLVSSQTWTIGTGSVGIFDDNGTASENIRELGTGPNGVQTILWKAAPDGNAQADGGWDTQHFPIDRTKMYRFSIWIKKTNSNDGHSYFGCRSNDILTLAGAVNTNPYFWYGDLPELNKWYLLVGYVHAHNDPSTSSYGGVYDGTTGTKVASATDFKFSASATTAVHRTYLYYDANTSDRQYFYNPEVYMMAQNQPLQETTASVNFNEDAFFAKKVGIGTNNPVFGTLQVTQPSDASDKGIGVLNSTGVRALRLWADPDNSYVYSGTTGQANLILNGTGNVGIGTTTPNEKLTVNGTIYGKEVKVDLNVPGPDYVFDEHYNLVSLDEIKAYIEKNKHLPEVPSAKEMEANGIRLSEMNMILLKKVEELTLHIIELKEEVEKLKASK